MDLRQRNGAAIAACCCFKEIDRYRPTVRAVAAQSVTGAGAHAWTEVDLPGIQEILGLRSWILGGLE
jgi:hypothetical protein